MLAEQQARVQRKSAIVATLLQEESRQFTECRAEPRGDYFRQKNPKVSNRPRRLSDAPVSSRPQRLSEAQDGELRGALETTDAHLIHQSEHSTDPTSGSSSSTAETQRQRVDELFRRLAVMAKTHARSDPVVWKVAVRKVGVYCYC